MQWRLDIVGPLPNGSTKKKFILFATNYFIKWVEAKSCENVKDNNIKPSSGGIWSIIMDSYRLLLYVMVYNLLANLLGHSAWIGRFNFVIPLWDILKGIGKLKP